MKRLLTLCALAALTMSATWAQTVRKFTVNITPDGKANMVCYLPQQPSGRAVVDLPGGGYTHLAVDHEGHDWAEYFNSQGIAFFVVTYRMPAGDRSIPMGDAQNAIRIVRPAGRIVVGSVYAGFADKVEMRPVMRKELTIVGAKGPYPNLNAEGSSASLDMLVKLQDDLRRIITVYETKDAIRAFEDMMSGRAIKSVITFQ